MKNIMIVIPVHNGAGLIEKTFDSLLKQTYPEFKVVVVDNCSDDNTEQCVEDFKQQCSPNRIEVEYIKNEKNLGRIGNWNKALDVFRHSSYYNYCKLMFVGDYLDKDCLTKQIIANAGMVSCAHYVVNTDKEDYIMRRFDTNTYLSQKECLEKQGNWYAGTTACVLFHKTALGDLKFTEDLDWAGDWKFWAEMSSRVGISYLSEPLAYFNMKARKGYNRMAGSEQAQKEEEIVKKYIKELLDNSKNIK